MVLYLEKRQGRKTITRLTGMELFGIDPEILASELKIMCASSTTVSPVVGVKSSQPQVEVMIQGSKLKEVCQSLTKYGIPFTGKGKSIGNSKFLEVIDKT